ncbi:hypothetical protein [Burkholderia sp. Ac-20365]|uniref:hypothetical protein n=1 Tax=Burkholderia sp. Ac-20365 TaxID=2703897 RepID=UPI00197C864D|nr:hypothetical protein [Burkholderia sp. Ac-20365]MBN3767396.1 hypothetical protein [Burkholderia sp. Ac-20365]
MRLVFRIDSNQISVLPAGLAVCIALALSSVTVGVNAQESFTDATTSTSTAAVQPATHASVDETSSATGDAATGVDIANETDTNGRQFFSVPADSIASSGTGEFALDDQILSRQRGGAAGMVMVAATPQLMHGSSVTLWDEIAPPSPLPIPIDAARAAQGNVANYQRK